MSNYTIHDVAKRADVAVGTVSRYLNGFKVRESNRVAIAKAIEDLGYAANPIARSLKSNKTYTVGFIFPNVTDHFASQVMESAEEVLANKNYSSVISGSRNLIENEKNRIEFFNNKRVDGLIIMPISDDSFENIKLIDEDIPYVIIDKKIMGLNANYITCNNFLGSYTGVKKLIDSGHTKIGIVTGEDNVYTSREREKGYHNALTDSNISIKDEYIKRDAYRRGAGYASIEELMSLEKPPTAIFTTNFELTMSAIKYFMSNGIEIGKDISLLGYDNMDMFQMIRPTVDTIEQPMFDIGKKAAQLLLEKIEGVSGKENYSIEFETKQISGASIMVLSHENELNKTRRRNSDEKNY